MELIDLLLETAGYLDSHHDVEAIALRGRCREVAERLYVEHEIGNVVVYPRRPLEAELPMAMPDQVKSTAVGLTELLAKPRNGYWTKKPCEEHANRFCLECPACNAKNSTFVEIGGEG